MSGGTSIYDMITNVGKSFSDAYASGQKQKLASDLGEKIKAGDYTGAADIALQGGDVQTGLALVKLGESRGASKQFGDLLGGLYAGGATTAPGGAGAETGSGTLGDLATGRRQSGSSLPSFAGGQAPMRVPGSGGEIENRFIGALKSNGLTNPFGLAAVAAYAGHESGYKGSNIAGSWSDPSESGAPGTSGGILSWRGDRFANMRRLTAGAQDPVEAQAKFTLTENPDLTLALQNAKSPEEANRLMADAWKFAGYNRPGGEAQARLNSTRAYVARLGGGGAPTPTVPSPGGAVAEADMPARDAQQTDFVIPPAQSGGPLTRIGGFGGQVGAQRLGLPSQSNTTGPGSTGAGSGPGSTVGGTGAQGEEDAGTPVPTARAPAMPGLPDLRVASELKQAGLPNQVALTAQRAAPGSPERVSALVRASLIPGLSEQQQSVVKTLLAHELQSTTQITNDQKEYAVGLTQGFKGTLQEWKAAQRPDRTKFVTGRDGQQYAVDPNNLDAAPRSLNLPGSVRVWGKAGPDGQIVQPPPNVPPNTAGYYDETGTPQLITGKGVQVTNQVGAGETAEAKTLGEARGKRANDIEAAAMKAPDQLGKLNLLGSVLERATTGTLGPAESKVVGLAQALNIPNETIANLGLNPDQAVTAQVATKLTNELVTGMIGGGGFPSNNFSNSDREFLTDIFPKMSNRPEANRMAIEVLKRVQQRNLETGDAWAEYQAQQREAGKPLSVAEFEFNHRKGLRGKPDLFADIRQQMDAMPKGGAGAGAAGSGATGASTPTFSPSSTRISMPDAQALKAAPDTPENRQVFDQRYGEGAAQYVLKKPAPEGASQPANPSAPAQPKTIAKGSSRQPMPPGVTTGHLISEAKTALADGRQRSVIEDRLRAYGIDPKRLEN